MVAVRFLHAAVCTALIRTHAWWVYALCTRLCVLRHRVRVVLRHRARDVLRHCARVVLRHRRV